MKMVNTYDGHIVKGKVCYLLPLCHSRLLYQSTVELSIPLLHCVAEKQSRNSVGDFHFTSAVLLHYLAKLECSKLSPNINLYHHD